MVFAPLIGGDLEAATYNGRKNAYPAKKPKLTYERGAGTCVNGHEKGGGKNAKEFVRVRGKGVVRNIALIPTKRDRN